MHLSGPHRIAHRMKTAFTLIELLVVIAIIAILAAILFPVFAQAKAAAKKTADLSNIKQMGTAAAMYSNDFDDLNPQQCGKFYGNWGYGYGNLVPANLIGTGGYADFSASYVMNAMQPYVKSYQVMQIPGAPSFNVWGSYPLAVTPQSATYTFNGLLTSYPTTAVASPSQLPEFTELNGFANVPGFSYANPMLVCQDGTQACTYTPDSAAGCATGNGNQGWIYQNEANAGYWSNGIGQNWVLADSHAKWQHMGAVTGNFTTTWVPTDWKIDPMAYYNSTGNSYWYWVDPNYCFPYLFRPDFDFNFVTGL